MPIPQEVQTRPKELHRTIRPDYTYRANGEPIACQDMALAMARCLLYEVGCSSTITTVEAKNHELLAVRPPFDSVAW